MLKKVIFHIRQKFSTTKLKNFKAIKDEESGQTFVEFIFLLLVLVILSTVLVTGFNTALSRQWKALIQAISMPNDTDNYEL